MSENKPHLSILRNLKIGSFHIGSSMADVLGSGVWNRVMIQDLGYAATPVGFLLALRYFLAPISVWAGAQSDKTNVRGYRRLPWVWGGRLAMVFGYLLVAISTIELVRYGSQWWLGIIIGFLVASIGQTSSGSTFLALVYDRAPNEERGRAVGVVWTFLLAGYAIAGILFERLLPTYSETEFVTFFVTVGTIMMAIWVFATWGEETPQRERPASDEPKSTQPDLMNDLCEMLQSQSARLLVGFMFLSFMAAFMQDTLLEPFGGNVFALTVGETTRFQAYWGTMAILSSIAALVLYRRIALNAYQKLAGAGVLTLIVTFILLAITASNAIESLLRPSLLLLGVGYGLWNIGTVGLMVKLSRESSAGLDLGVWTVVATICRGSGVFFGAVLFDGFSSLLGEAASAYAVIFALEAVLLMASLPVLAQIRLDPITEKATETELVLAGSMD